MRMSHKKNSNICSNVENKSSLFVYDRMTNFEDGVLAIELGKLDKAEKIFDEMIKCNQDDYEALNKLGIVYAKKKNFMLAREYFEQALCIKEDYGHALVNVGNTYKECGDNINAKKYYELAITNDPKYNLSYYNLAIIYKANGEYFKYMKNIKEYKSMYKLFENTEKSTIIRSLKDKKVYKGVLLIFLFFILFMSIT